MLNPIYQMFSAAGMLNTRIGLALVLAAVELPTAVWLLTSFFQTVPFEIEESAMIDGASMIRIYSQIVLPLVAPGVFTVSIITFIAAWNNFIFAAVLNQYKTARTVTIALTMFETETYTPWHVISAASVIVSVPLIIVVMLLQKRIISGLMEGGVKG
jgi:multiple sugar transport system permease protein